MTSFHLVHKVAVRGSASPHHEEWRDDYVESSPPLAGLR